MDNKKDDVPPQPDLYVDLCFPYEDMKVLREKYKFVDSSPSADDDYFKNLGFNRKMDTLVCTRDRKKNDNEDDVKKYLREFVEQAKASKALSRMSKKVKQVPSSSGPRRGRKSVLDMQKQGPSTSAPPRRRKSMPKIQKQVPSTSVPRRRRTSKPVMPKMPEMPEMPQMSEMPEMPQMQSFNNLFRAIELDGASR